MNIQIYLYSILNSAFSKEAVTFLSAALPLFELRLAVPLGIIKYGIPPFMTFLLALVGNFIPVIPLLYILRRFFHGLQRMPGIGAFFRWWFQRVERRSHLVRRWGFWGLVLFVSIPLPVTGAWTGTVAATLVEMKTGKALGAIALGIACAGLIMTALSVLFRSTLSSWLTFV